MLSLNTNVSVPKVRRKQKNLGKNLFLLEEGEKRRIWSRIHYQNVMDPEHWSMQIYFMMQFMSFYIESFVGTHCSVYALKQN
jgi:hypothetical protein